MKKSKFKLLLLFIGLVAITGTTLSSCNDDDDDGNTSQIDLLINTKWELVKFVDVSNGAITIPAPDDTNYYWIIFNSDKTIKGYGHANEFDGTYSINNNKLNILVGAITEVESIYRYETDFLNALNTVNRFTISNNILKLYYNNGNNYLEYERK